MKVGFIHSTRLVLSLVEAAVVASERFRDADQLHIADDILVRELVETKGIGGASVPGSSSTRAACRSAESNVSC